MLINFNIEKLDRLLCDFYSLTGLTISVWDKDFRQLSWYPKEMRTFCRMIKSSEEGRKRCFISDKKLCAECLQSGMPTTHYCHAGLIDYAVPIKFRDSVLGYIMFGQIAAKEREDMLPDLRRIADEAGLDFECLVSAYESLDFYGKEKADSAANILKLATRYLWLSEYIDVGYNVDSVRINDYISKHIGESISVKDLCLALGIPKKRLYEISHKWFGMPIGDYISNQRINEAKRLLSTTDYPISKIAYTVGIVDYNYFTKFFRKRVGVSPAKYRKCADSICSEDELNE